MTEKQIHVVAEVVSTPDSVERVWEALQRLIEPTRSEPGNIAYDVLQDNDKPEHYLVYETWASQNDFNGHVKSDHFAEFDRSVQGILSEPVRIVLSTLRS